MRRTGRPLAVVFVVGIAVVVSVKAHGDPAFWPVAVPGVLTGCGTLGLAGVTYEVLRGDQADRRKRDEQDSQRTNQERRAQAAKVQVLEPKQVEIDAAGEGFDLLYQVVVENRSDDAIGEGTIILAVKDRIVLTAPVESPVLTVGRVTAGEDAMRRWQVKLPGIRGVPHKHSVLVWFTFRDAAGVLWVRDPDHRLVEIDWMGAARLVKQANCGMTNGLDPADDYEATHTTTPTPIW